MLFVCSQSNNNLPMKQQEQYRFEYLDQYKIIKQLGSGYQAFVYLAADREGNHVAIKKFKKLPSVTNSMEEELKAMEELHHQNLIKLISVRQNAVFKTKQNFTTNCFAFILEYAGGGELFDFVADTGKFSQKVTRTYFHQMMNGIHYMHQKGYAHRDIKPQNLLLSDTFILKIADFGFTCLLKGRDGKGILRTKLGTEGYMAPQIFMQEYQGRKIDIFAAGVILFIMYTGTPPFEKATTTDPYYKLIKEKKLPTFWQSHSKKKPPGYFSDSFKDLFQKMVANQPEERLTIYEIAKHPWVKSTICTHSEIKKQFTQRKKRLQQILQDRRRIREYQQYSLNESISNEGSSFRKAQQNQSFLLEYDKMKIMKRNWTSMEIQDGLDVLVKNHNTQFVMCMTKKHLAAQQFDLQFKTAQEEDLIEAECESFIMKAEEAIIEQETLKVTFIYKTMIKHAQIPHRLTLKFHFGKNSIGNTIIRMEPQDGHFYSRLVIRNIQTFFS